ncbi:cyclic pyranopterin monophosphate synthase [Deltaproteobacteria bacterium]|nr:cyclic pyranopterin monophosphate synthase [Deltaproteobacteria bacterium]
MEALLARPGAGRSALTAPGGRALSYLRLSVTDLCNLRCRYCMPLGGVPKLRHADILSYEEIRRLIDLALPLGLTKLRFTGGEPLVRKDLLAFLRLVRGQAPSLDLRLTTNGVLLEPVIPELRAVGLGGLNLSLNALDPDVYAAMAGRPGAEGRELARRARAGLQAAVRAGLPVKINCVPWRGLNDGQLLPLARLALDWPVEVRFIEHMPIGSGDLWRPENFLSTAEVQAGLSRALGPLSALDSPDPAAPTRRFSFAGAVGALGFISGVSWPFCGACNRLRLTADGRLKPCLMTADEIDLRAPLRAGADDAALAALFQLAAGRKPLVRPAAAGRGTPGRPMSGIGG